jgi:short-subunit dehydrogenase
VFTDQRVLITGASSGLGEEFARQLAARKAKLIITARSTGKLETLAAELRGLSPEVHVVSGDLGAPGGAAALCDELTRRGLAVDLLVSNAGFGTHGALVEQDPARQAEMVRLNCEALTYLSTRLLPPMVARKAGGILHIASIAGYQPVPFMATYGASKAYVLSFSQALSEEMRGTGVRVCALNPGPVQTGFQAVAGAAISQGQRRAVLSAEETVKRGLAAWEAGRDLCVPGGYNKLGTLGVRLLPRKMIVRTVGKMMRTRERNKPL